jgi:hypothetical protein
MMAYADGFAIVGVTLLASLLIAPFLVRARAGVGGGGH